MLHTKELLKKKTEHPHHLRALKHHASAIAVINGDATMQKTQGFTTTGRLLNPVEDRRK